VPHRSKNVKGARKGDSRGEKQDLEIDPSILKRITKDGQRRGGGGRRAATEGEKRESEGTPRPGEKSKDPEK